ncbi:MAG: hypothetical protein A2504_02735 [Bdellovibrionales bacterium RIFOXYD12_FULL_39_22]|nr:MAG: hypothetical protein A2385_05450 [Bdellovibrionales bacterium RIFOXYB1_FULL_39_21]OFZ42203.1 MAG: hypothetical protein A2485_15480 [Bdellovibrionales bacterium RIFOXYC12_FULL_39_17]OFZ46705.1 MAG: hypothetical protein A2404_04190 [Bdellovibrionales bacterium RIFOXYC1_FULL_39_130]OFZ76018.1 MAG: hypothetical protein A2560_02960 [Bdellovibrionales bacterium RIFOXYD1_FULL_39_84]OFZ93002.1 MAG: hypothetical protein A2504_02735 [Bdellovibrionales bacterium RIFOXYD12_FULL_39_22]HLE09890.1 OA
MDKQVSENVTTNNLIKPYGDTLNDGVIQVSFTLPVELSAKAKKAAELYLEKLNLTEVQISFAEKLTDGFTFFVAYGKAIPSLDYNSVEATEVSVLKMNFYEINNLIKMKLNRKLIVVGATIGTDAHTVGIDAIMNMKGYDGDYGLERYPEIDAYNMGSQVTPEALLKKALEVKADAILVSQTVTQKDAHIRNFTEFIELLEAEQLRSRFLICAGGPRVSNDLACELGYDAGFGPGTLPSMVASYLITTLIERKGVSHVNK